MRNMAVSKDVIVRPDARDFAVTGRAMNRDIFAECIVAADFRARDTSVPFQVLRL